MRVYSLFIVWFWRSSMLNLQEPSTVSLPLQTRIRRLFNCVYGIVWNESVSDLSYLSLIAQCIILTALVLSLAGKCVSVCRASETNEIEDRCKMLTHTEGDGEAGEGGLLGCGGSWEVWTWVNQYNCSRHEVTGFFRLSQSGNFGGSSFVGGWMCAELTPFLSE